MFKSSVDVYKAVDAYRFIIIDIYTRSPSQDLRLFGPRPWKVLATNYL